MICDEVREYLFAFLDDELEVRAHMDLQCHLDHCPECARQAAVERAIRRQLARAMKSDRLVGLLDEHRAVP